MQKLLYLIILMVSFQFNAVSQCEVSLASISGTYEGGCKKGKAEGKGKSVGTDTYEGTFKKGYPNGEGVYTWANGDVYTGSFKKGEKEGEGKIIKADGGSTVGYWSGDEYIGTEKNPYSFSRQSSGISSLKASRNKSDKDLITLNFKSLGKPIVNPNFDVQLMRGSFTSKQSLFNKGELSGLQFPFEAQITINGSDFVVALNIGGNWTIDVDTNK